MEEPIVITGIGMITSVGADRESTWEAVQQGVSGVQRLRGFSGVPDDVALAARVPGCKSPTNGQRNVPLGLTAALEAIGDSEIELQHLAPHRFGSAIGVNVGDSPGAEGLRRGARLHGEEPRWWREFLPSTTAAVVPLRLGLLGPRLCNSTACATGAVTLVQARRLLQQRQCDAVLAGAAQSLHPILVAGFHKMRVLAHHDNPHEACRPFDANRNGFVMGEGAAMFVVERLTDARDRGARIYAEIAGAALANDAHHVTDLSTDSTTLTRLLGATLRSAHLAPADVQYINAHGTGTLQNDVMESRGIRAAFRSAADQLCVSSTKAILGHLVNAAGAVETAITALALRDGFAPPTVNLTDPDPLCDLDCIPMVGRQRDFEHAVKISIAFGGHLAALALRRWSGADARQQPVGKPRVAA